MKKEGQFKKGTGGRPKGSKNKVNHNLREMISKFLKDQWPQLLEDWGQLSPKQRVIMFEKLSGYVVPKYSSVNTNIDSMNDSELAKLAEVIRENGL
jgi:hypothetical protein